MKVETIGKRQFVFGMQWVPLRDGASEDIQHALGGAVDVGESLIYQTVLKPAPASKKKLRRASRKATGPAKRKGAAIDEDPSHVSDKGAPETAVVDEQDSGVVGFFVAESKFKAIYSAAASVAALKKDGLYVVALDEDMAWYCGISGGVIVPATDVVGPSETIVETVKAMSHGLGLQVWADPVLEVAESTDFALDSALSATKPTPLKSLSGGVSPVTIVLAIGVVGGLAFFGYTALKPARPKLTPTQQQAQLRARYVSSVGRKLSTYPASSGWVMRAYMKSRRSLPSIVAGWALNGVSCTPASCQAHYAVIHGSAFAISPLLARFGSRVHMLRNGHSLNVSMPLHTPIQHVDEAFVRSVPHTRVPFMDWIGMVPVTIAGATIKGHVLTQNLGHIYNSSGAGMPALVLEQASIQGAGFIGPSDVLDAVAAGSRGGFRPIQFAWSPGVGAVPASWRMTWERVHD